jgi:hypothetical protein
MIRKPSEENKFLLPPIGPSHNQDDPLAPLGNRDLSAIALRLFGGIRLDLMAAISAPHDRRTPAAAELPSTVFPK